MIVVAFNDKYISERTILGTQQGVLVTCSWINQNLIPKTQDFKNYNFFKEVGLTLCTMYMHQIIMKYQIKIWGQGGGVRKYPGPESKLGLKYSGIKFTFVWWTRIPNHSCGFLISLCIPPVY